MDTTKENAQDNMEINKKVNQVQSGVSTKTSTHSSQRMVIKQETFWKMSKTTKKDSSEVPV